MSTFTSSHRSQSTPSLPSSSRRAFHARPPLTPHPSLPRSRSLAEDEDDPFGLTGFFSSHQPRSSHAPSRRRTWISQQSQLDPEHYRPFSSTMSPSPESDSPPVTPGALLSPLLDERDDELSKEIRSEDKLGVLSISTASFFSAPSHAPSVLYSPLKEDEAPFDDESLYTSLTSRRENFCKSQSTDTNTTPSLLFLAPQDETAEDGGWWNILQLSKS
ncbi:hypothetical protein BOTBODRAFT_37171 [Botryobasidium botryosum FD-172 SS1]|uniref:Uncharacterized protein n=1 Tax=Botryobasidium botryosum (strain FD-172 SS1) TaxID=930990 RepID=A0A067M123_BOTB1|nr:hypothetical protein BOTBODRAFT_37171 [Botryobasidium botryosum FD-172 SS1]